MALQDVAKQNPAFVMSESSYKLKPIKLKVKMLNQVQHDSIRNVEHGFTKYYEAKSWIRDE
ncbi:MAG: hypothetical protein KGZ81_15350 [Flavobacteriales bacterium]|nr:hypothetical protein [Flavobacteriales bacterium]